MLKHTTVKSGEHTIAVHEAGTSGPAIVFCHGNSASSRAWSRQLESPLAERFRLVALDFPGHGESSRPATPEVYDIPGLARVLVDVTRQLGIRRAIHVGWSLGGHVVLEASDALDAAGLLIFGTPPLAFPPAMDRAFRPHPAMAVTFKSDATEEEGRLYVSSFFRPGAQVPPVFLEEFARADGRLRSNLAASIRPGGYKDEVELVARLSIPLAVLHGAEEQLIDGRYFETLTMPTLWRGAPQFIEGAGHAPQWEQPERFNELLASFARDCA